MVTLRIARPEDAPALLDIYAYYVENTAITYEYDVPSVTEFAARIRHTLEKFPYLVAEEDGVPLGYAYAHAYHERAAYGWTVECSIYTARDHRHQGLGRRLYTALETILTIQGVLNCIACVAVPDRADEYLTRNSLDFHLHMGYRLAGTLHHCGCKFDRWYNMAYLEKWLGAHVGSALPVLPFPEIRDAAAALLTRS